MDPTYAVLDFLHSSPGEHCESLYRCCTLQLQSSAYVDTRLARANTWIKAWDRRIAREKSDKTASAPASVSMGQQSLENPICCSLVAWRLLVMASGRQGQGCSALESLKAASEGTERPPDGTGAQWVRGLAAGSRLLTSPILANHRQQ